MGTEAPKIDERKASELVKLLQEMAPHYTPEWTASDENDPGVALLKIFSYMTENVVNRFNRVPHKNFVAFLDMLGVKLLPAQSARVPLSFTLAKGTEKEILIPARTQAAADKTEEHKELPFETENNLLAIPSQLKRVISVDPRNGDGSEGDSIYLPPPRFLEAENKSETSLAYEISSSPLAGDTDFQLDHVTGLEEGDFLQIGNGDKKEYVIISSISGMIVTVEDKLVYSQSPDTNVEKVTKFKLFEGKNQQEHSLYLGHKDLFNVKSPAQFILDVKHRKGSESGVTSLNGSWEYWGELEGKEGWHKFQTGGSTSGLSTSGEIELNKISEGEIKERDINGVKSRWIRCILEEHLPVNVPGILPVLDNITLGAKSADGNLLPDQAFNNETPIDISKLFYPFGKEPRVFDSFAIGSKDAFSKKGAKITIEVVIGKSNSTPVKTDKGGSLDKNDPTPTLSWEYWNNKGWVSLKGLEDNKTSNFLKSGNITFKLPEDIEETAISGQKNYWIRTRLVGGDYGKETFAMEFMSASGLTNIRTSSVAPTSTNRPLVRVISNKDTIQAPSVDSLSISYSLETEKFPEKCFAYNNLEYLDHSKACITEDKHFTPFVQLEDKEKTLYLGFEKPFKDGPVRIFFAATELPFTKEKKPKMEWTYRGKDSWKDLSYLDATEALIRAELLELIGPSDFAIHPNFGDSLYWIKGNLAKGEYENTPLLDGIYPNTTWGLQAETIKDEIMGSSNGEAEQTFSLIKFPVLEKQEIRVMEVLSEEEKQKLIDDHGISAIFPEKNEKGNVTGTWVIWTEIDDFFDSAPDDRHYILDHATGKVQFGDGIKGMVPPAGNNNIRAFAYQAGGGMQGNVKAREIKTLKSAVGGVDKVLNPVAADGGADTATLEQMLEIGPTMISHRERAVSEEDFEWLAREASRKILKVKCLPNTVPDTASGSNNKYRSKAGCVTVIIVPDSKEDKPRPSLELRTKVQKHLETHCANTLAFSESVYVSGPYYIEIGVQVDVFITSIDVAFKVESEARKKLNAFFHPLTGGSLGEGWDFGRNVSASDIYALLEGIEGVDHVENLELVPNGVINKTTGSDIVEIDQHSLVANGTHIVNVLLVEGDKHRESAYS